MSKVPAIIKMHPSKTFKLQLSCKKIKARQTVKTTEVLSIGTTLLAEPVCNALK